MWNTTTNKKIILKVYEIAVLFVLAKSVRILEVIDEPKIQSPMMPRRI